MRKNVAGQVVKIWAWDNAACDWKSGDAANITGYYSLDDGAPVSLGAPTELHATNHKGCYYWILTAAQTNGDNFSLYADSTTANIKIAPVVKDTVS